MLVTLYPSFIIQPNIRTAINFEAFVVATDSLGLDMTTALFGGNSLK